MIDKKEYRRLYAKKRYDARLAKMRALLGGKCVECGAEDGLEIHHKDKARKKFVLSTKHSLPWPIIEEELKKCELRCKSHHIKVHEAKHGTISRYRSHKCRCDACCKVWSEYCKPFRERKRLRLRAAGLNRDGKPLQRISRQAKLLQQHKHGNAGS